MTEDDAHRRLTSVPKALRDRLVAARDDLPHGALLAVGRFYAALDRRGEQADAPSAQTFAAAGRSRTGLAVLLRTLTQHQAGEEVCLAEGRHLLKTRYQELMRRGTARRPRLNRGRRPKAPPKARLWPEAWLALRPGLLGAPLRPTTVTGHLYAINRCAECASGLACPPRFSWLFAWELTKAFEAQGTKNITIATRIGSLIALGRYGRLPPERLEGLRRVQASYQSRARRDPKVKAPRIMGLVERGGYAEVIAAIARLLARAEAEPDWSVASQRARATAAVLMVTVNVPPRTGDAATWRLGHELIREPWGEWRLAWPQGKTCTSVDVGRLWPETARVLDTHILGGRPRRLAVGRYDTLFGLNWLRLDGSASHASWPSRMVRRALGVPMHDVRTLAADYLRTHDPETAPEAVRGLLGHRTQAAGEAYRVLCKGDAAARRWHDIREGLEWDPLLTHSAEP